MFIKVQKSIVDIKIKGKRPTVYKNEISTQVGQNEIEKF